MLGSRRGRRLNSKSRGRARGGGGKKKSEKRPSSGERRRETSKGRRNSHDTESLDESSLDGSEDNYYERMEDDRKKSKKSKSRHQPYRKASRRAETSFDSDTTKSESDNDSETVEEIKKIEKKQKSRRRSHKKVQESHVTDGPTLETPLSPNDNNVSMQNGPSPAMNQGLQQHMMQEDIHPGMYPGMQMQQGMQNSMYRQPMQFPPYSPPENSGFYDEMRGPRVDRRLHTTNPDLFNVRNTRTYLQQIDGHGGGHLHGVSGPIPGRDDSYYFSEGDNRVLRQDPPGKFVENGGRGKEKFFTGNDEYTINML